MSQISMQDAKSMGSRSSSRFSFRNSSRRTHPYPHPYDEPHLVPEGKSDSGSEDMNFVSKFLGFRDLTNPEVWSGVSAEFIGMSCYEFLYVVSYIASLETRFKHPKLAASLVQLIVWGISILATSLFSRQQQHLNPSFTFVTVLTGHISVSQGTLYLVAQCGGSLLGAFGARELLLERKYMLAACTLDGLNNRVGIVTELLFTFVLIFVAFPIGLDYKRNPIQSERDLALASFVVGGVFGLLGFISSELGPGGYTGAGMNPARCFGVAVLGSRDVADSWKGHWIFWAGPLAAAVAFAVLYGLALPKKQQISCTEDPQLQAGVVNHQPERRMDVVLHIKAVHHRIESERFIMPIEV